MAPLPKALPKTPQKGLSRQKSAIRTLSANQGRFGAGEQEDAAGGATLEGTTLFCCCR
jgi:hypothetical protein